MLVERSIRYSHVECLLLFNVYTKKIRIDNWEKTFLKCFYFRSFFFLSYFRHNHHQPPLPPITKSPYLAMIDASKIDKTQKKKTNRIRIIIDQNQYRVCPWIRRCADAPSSYDAAANLWSGYWASTEALVAMGYNRQDIEESLTFTRYDDVFATYLLLGRKSTDVSFFLLSTSLSLVTCVCKRILRSQVFTCV